MVSGGPEPYEIEAIPENLLREPIDLLYADHFRQRVLCNAIEDIAGAPDHPAAVASAAAIARFLEYELALHVADEEQDLFPLLRARCRPQDQLECALALLAEEHAEERQLAATLIETLRAIAAGRPVRDVTDFVRTASAFVQAQRRHLAWENALILPLARTRLAAEDFALMGNRMAGRRGLAIPE